ncbi:hypothetical protein ACWD2L_00440 [Streptomyces sp. NPDC002754]
MTCIWPADMSCCEEWSSYPVEVRASALITASDILWALSGRVFTGEPLSSAFTPEEIAELEALGYTDGCSTILRPCKQHCGSPCDTCGWPGDLYGANWYAPWAPYMDNGRWFNATCGTCGDRCQCGTGLDVLALPGPVAKVNAVYVDGTVFTDWALYNADMLVRTDGEQWPGCQSLDKDLTEEGTWGVDYTRGVPVPEGGKRAVAQLACDFARLCAGDKRCRIPANVVAVTRDGVSYDLDPTSFYAEGKTSIPAVDIWLASVNPKHIPRPFGVYTPQTVRRDGYVRRQPGEVTP